MWKGKREGFFLVPPGTVPAVLCSSYALGPLAHEGKKGKHFQLYLLLIQQ